MNGNETDVRRDLDMLISKKAKIGLPEAKMWQWRVLNEYPEDLAEVVIAWVCDRPLPSVEYNEISFERILRSTVLGFLEAAELMYILYKDPAGGYRIFTASLGRDFGRRG